MIDPNKAELRQRAVSVRRKLGDKPQRSRQCLEQACSLESFKTASTVLWYIDVRGELMTTDAVGQELIANERRCVVPYCDGDELRLVEIQRWDELETGAFGILEPAPAIRELEPRHVSIRDVDLVFVPGVAFDRCGGRLGYGKGYYDRLLSQAPERLVRIGLAFDCQVLTALPTQPHDIPMHWIVTESEVLACAPLPGVHSKGEAC